MDHELDARIGGELLAGEVVRARIAREASDSAQPARFPLHLIQRARGNSWRPRRVRCSETEGRAPTFFLPERWLDRYPLDVTQQFAIVSSEVHSCTPPRPGAKDCAHSTTCVVLLAGTDCALGGMMPIPTSSPLGRRAHSQTSRIEVAEVPAWLRSLASELKEGHDVVLVVADEPLQQRLVETLRPMAREVLAANQLLDAKQILQCRSEQIAAAIISSQPGWGLKLRALLAAEYPAIRRVALIA